MEDEEKLTRVVVTDAWKKEQQAKQRAYEAKRRAWMQHLERTGDPEEDEAETSGVAPASRATEPGVTIPERRGRWGGTIQDKRQVRFRF
jgi:hypothetical protein